MRFHDRQHAGEFTVRKLGVPGHEEYACGAIAAPTAAPA
jgi:predicted phosphoribosyltransferase